MRRGGCSWISHHQIWRSRWSSGRWEALMEWWGYFWMNSLINWDYHILIIWCSDNFLQRIYQLKWQFEMHKKNQEERTIMKLFTVATACLSFPPRCTRSIHRSGCSLQGLQGWSYLQWFVHFCKRLRSSMRPCQPSALDFFCGKQFWKCVLLVGFVGIWEMIRIHLILGKGLNYYNRFLHPKPREVDSQQQQ